MFNKKYTDFSEELFTETLSNGLTVNLLPKKGFHKTYAIFTTNFGSMDNQMLINGNVEEVPAGTAHFLEHKLFEKKDYDAFELFSSNGADSNAFTSYSRTSYLFSATSNLRDNLNSLLDFVQIPYFSEKSVKKEQGIIGQEIEMYNDDPDWQLYMGILRNLFPEQALSTDIAGTVSSISEITPEILYKIHSQFYHPSNMNLFMAGNFNPNEAMGWIKNNQEQKSFSNFPDIKRTENINKAPIDSGEIVLEVARPKIMLGIKNIRLIPFDKKEKLRFLIALDLAFYLLLSSSSQTYLKLYDQRILDDSFGYEVNSEREFVFVTIGGDTENPERFEDAMRVALSKPDWSLLTSDFELAKREMIGRSISKMNSLEAIANSFEGKEYGNSTIFDEAKIYQNIKIDEVQKAFNWLMDGNKISSFRIKRK
ncbi:EF-P 5-aminopentanol modification-associated protein YfmH [Pediococcus claussenii]|uniref:Peptidase M16 inactive domain protein n=1 Tax=Pediococcus claussenii (strain ATCC BAA-344 / DSM 14800 / JCM 18046 / KCTC 3811 / LMG 21948 / P06) TaxID=701521 RepID=G8PCL1_PEDCP|nr:insulinase family protein [Pediococcus claussenii]AEV94996.1 peptidase M16 inactive domain protein [Pediococcus claussenii ATCC BAA-344]ANZ70185.1 peptidase M16 [Pediococcus claussenii]ANZ72001.1 peptidase M16 [Pediococcus claussenii]KRN19202.1 hypothetical protein IV79_GL001574 [Pediococcus claussenii]